LHGDCWNIPGNVEHSAKIIEDAIAVEVFSPVHKDYLPDNLFIIEYKFAEKIS